MSRRRLVAGCVAAAPLALALALWDGAGAPARAEPAAQLFERPIGGLREAGFNRVVARGPRLSAARAAAGMTAGIGRAGAAVTAAATGNVVSVTQNGGGNTLSLTVDQVNTGAVSAGAALNGRLR